MHRSLPLYPMQDIQHIFPHPKPIIGVVHLLPLPGSPRYAGSMQTIVARAILDADTLLANGVDGLIVENYGDAPFFPDCVEAHTIASMSILVREIRQQFPKAVVGVNVLRNDARAALAIATVCEAHFIRINVHTGTMLTDQGIIQGTAHHTVRYRTHLGSTVHILADVAVKHAVPLAPTPLVELAEDTYYRGLADGLIVTGTATGRSARIEDITALKTALPTARVFVGSGVTTETLGTVLAHADGVIVGTAVKRDGITSNPVDAERVKALVRARTNSK